MSCHDGKKSNSYLNPTECEKRKTCLLSLHSILALTRSNSMYIGFNKRNHQQAESYLDCTAIDKPIQFNRNEDLRYIPCAKPAKYNLHSILELNMRSSWSHFGQESKLSGSVHSKSARVLHQLPPPLAIITLKFKCDRLAVVAYLAPI